MGKVGGQTTRTHLCFLALSWQRSRAYSNCANSLVDCIHHEGPTCVSATLLLSKFSLWFFLYTYTQEITSWWFEAFSKHSKTNQLESCLSQSMELPYLKKRFLKNQLESCLSGRGNPSFKKVALKTPTNSLRTPGPCPPCDFHRSLQLSTVTSSANKRGGSSVAVSEIFRK